MFGLRKNRRKEKKNAYNKSFFVWLKRKKEKKDKVDLYKQNLKILFSSILFLFKF